MAEQMRELQAYVQNLTQLVVNNVGGENGGNNGGGGNPEDIGGDSDSRDNNSGRPYTRFHQNRTRGDEFNVDLPEFEGKLDADAFIDWLRTFENIFEHKEVEGELKVKLVAVKLRGYACTWLCNEKARRARAGRPKIQSWEKLKKKLKAKFLPLRYVQDNFAQLHKLRQGTKTVRNMQGSLGTS